MRLLSLLIGLILIAPAALTDDTGPTVGSSLPDRLETLDQGGNPQSFSSLKRDRGMVLVFFRSADWCPYCKKQLIALNKVASTIDSLGYALVGLSYDSPQKLAKFTKKRAIGFTLLSDEGSRIIDTFGLRDTSYPQGHYADGVPHPTILIIDQAGVIRHKFFSDDYKKRPEVDVILEALAG